MIGNPFLFKAYSLSASFTFSMYQSSYFSCHKKDLDYSTVNVIKISFTPISKWISRLSFQGVSSLIIPSSYCLATSLSRYSAR